MKIEIDGVEYIPKHEVIYLLNITEDEFKTMPIGNISVKRIDNRIGSGNELYKKQDILGLQKFMGVTIQENDTGITFAGVKYEGLHELSRILGLSMWQVMAWERIKKLEKEYESRSNH